jgi:N-acetylglucosaminyldiphosphoundecaprenol N-acetyl-beta-D-mannosaminyltransferase
MSDRLNVLGVRIDRAGPAESLAHIDDFLQTPGCKQIVTVNPEYVILAGKSDRLKRLLNRTELNVPDGMGIVWASRLLGEPLTSRVTGTDLLPGICGLCAERGIGIFFLGGKPGVAGKAAANLSERFPGLEVAGTSSRDPDAETDMEIVNQINESGAQVLAVAYGCPKQDFWIERNRDRLTSIRVAIGVGGAFDFISGEVPRAPRALRRAGMEWLFRLWVEPTRARRMMALPRFGWRVLRSKRTS